MDLSFGVNQPSVSLTVVSNSSQVIENEEELAVDDDDVSRRRRSRRGLPWRPQRWSCLRGGGGEEEGGILESPLVTPGSWDGDILPTKVEVLVGKEVHGGAQMAGRTRAMAQQKV